MAGGWTVTGETVLTTTAVFISDQQIQCSLPDGGGSFQVTISHRAHTPISIIITVLTFDTRCYNCDFEGTCTQVVSRFIRLISSVL